jgi:hypothetical protein
VGRKDYCDSWHQQNEEPPQNQFCISLFNDIGVLFSKLLLLVGVDHIPFLTRHFSINIQLFFRYRIFFLNLLVKKFCRIVIIILH